MMRGGALRINTQGRANYQCKGPEVRMNLKNGEPGALGAQTRLNGEGSVMPVSKSGEGSREAGRAFRP